MKIFKSLILSLVVGSVVSLTATISQAAIFNFSFTNVDGNTAGTITGEIILPDFDDYTGAATSVSITSGPSSLNINSPINLDSYISTNNFMVSDGILESFSFVGATAGAPYALLVLNNTYAEASFGFGEYIIKDLTGQSINVSVSAVPLPAALPLYGAGLAVMGFIGWRRNRKTAATA